MRGGIFHHDGLWFDPDKTGSCSKVVLGERLLEPVDIDLPADIIDPVQAQRDHGFMPPLKTGKLPGLDSCSMQNNSLKRK
jgi:hypothetical protein